MALRLSEGLGITRRRNFKVFADLSSKHFVDFSMAWNSGRLSRLSIDKHRVTSALSQEFTSMFFKKPDEINALHYAAKTSVSRITVFPTNDSSARERLASITNSNSFSQVCPSFLQGIALRICSRQLFHKGDVPFWYFLKDSGEFHWVPLSVR